MEILTAYVREHAPIRAEPPLHMAEIQEPVVDIQATLTVLGRQARPYGRRVYGELDLRSTDLRRANLDCAHLEGVFLYRASLHRASLMFAHLGRACFVESHLEGAIFSGADLRGATFWDAHLEGAVIVDALLEGATFAGAHLEGTMGLTVEQLARVTTLYQAHLDRPLLEQIQQQYPHLLEKPQGGICRWQKGSIVNWRAQT